MYSSQLNLILEIKQTAGNTTYEDKHLCENRRRAYSNFVFSYERDGTYQLYCGNYHFSV